jgi:type II secretory pathway pseudopilin PulG
MMRRLAGLVIGFLLFFPGALILQWLVVDELGIYQDMTLTDALLAIIIILAGVVLFGQPRRELTAEELEKQAEKMELASRRLEQAQRQHAQAVRAQRLNRRASSASRSRRAPGSASARSSRSDRSSRSARSSRSSGGDRRRRR